MQWPFHRIKLFLDKMIEYFDLRSFRPHVTLCKTTLNEHVCTCSTLNWVRVRDRIFHSKCILHLNVVESQGGDIKNHPNETSLVGGCTVLNYFVGFYKVGERQLYGHQGLEEGGSWWKCASLSFETKMALKSYPLGWYIPMWLKYGSNPPHWVCHSPQFAYFGVNFQKLLQV